MAKRSKRKNIILTNLPAAIALILMAVALKITLKFSFFISLLILIIVYFILGVLIELIIDKIDTKKKKADLFKKYAEGKSGQLPAFEDEPEEDDIAYEVKPQKEAFEVSKKGHRRFAVGSLYETEEAESPAFIRKEESASEESETVKEEEIPEKAIDVFRGEEPEHEEEQELPEKPEDESVPDPEPEPETEQESVTEAESESISSEASEENVEGEDRFLDIRLNDLNHEVPEKQNLDSAFQNLFDKKIDEIENEAETAVEVPETDEIPSEEATETNSEEEAALENEVQEAETADVPEQSESIEAEPVSEEDTALTFTEPGPEIKKEESEAENDIPFVPEADEELIEALKDVGAIGNEHEAEIPGEEAEARRSLFDESDDFDAGLSDGGKKNPSIIFGSVPDTDDDFEYIPVSDTTELPATVQKGKVKVDAKKIDDLYSFKKGKTGEKFFGRRKK